MFTKRLDTILASFHKTIDDLKKLEDNNDYVIAKNNGAIQKLDSENQVLASERVQASQVRTKIEQLVS